MTNQIKQNEGINPIAAAVAGVVVGAGVVAAGVVAMKDEKNVEKVRHAMTNVKDQATGKITEGKEEVKKVIDNAKTSMHKAANDVNKAVQSV